MKPNEILEVVTLYLSANTSLISLLGFIYTMSLPLLILSVYSFCVWIYIIKKMMGK